MEGATEAVKTIQSSDDESSEISYSSYRAGYCSSAGSSGSGVMYGDSTILSVSLLAALAQIVKSQQTCTPRKQTCAFHTCKVLCDGSTINVEPGGLIKCKSYSFEALEDAIWCFNDKTECTQGKDCVYPFVWKGDKDLTVITCLALVKCTTGGRLGTSLQCSDQPSTSVSNSGEICDVKAVVTVWPWLVAGIGWCVAISLTVSTIMLFRKNFRLMQELRNIQPST